MATNPIRDALALVVVDYFERNLFLHHEDEERTSTDLVDDLERAVAGAHSRELDAARQLLAEVESAAPRRKGSYSHSAQIPWAIVLRIRRFVQGAA